MGGERRSPKQVGGVTDRIRWVGGVSNEWAEKAESKASGWREATRW